MRIELSFLLILIICSPITIRSYPIQIQPNSVNHIGMSRSGTYLLLHEEGIQNVTFIHAYSLFNVEPLKIEFIYGQNVTLSLLLASTTFPGNAKINQEGLKILAPSISINSTKFDDWRVIIDFYDEGKIKLNSISYYYIATTTFQKLDTKKSGSLFEFNSFVTNGTYILLGEEKYDTLGAILSFAQYLFFLPLIGIPILVILISKLIFRKDQSGMSE